MTASAPTSAPPGTHWTHEIAQRALASRRPNAYCAVITKQYVRYRAYNVDRSEETRSMQALELATAELLPSRETLPGRPAGGSTSGIG